MFCWIHMDYIDHQYLISNYKRCGGHFCYLPNFPKLPPLGHIIKLNSLVFLWLREIIFKQMWTSQNTPFPGCSISLPPQGLYSSLLVDWKLRTFKMTVSPTVCVSWWMQLNRNLYLTLLRYQHAVNNTVMFI